MDRSPMSPSHDRDNISYFDEWAKKYDQGRITKWFQYTQSLTIGLIPLRKDSKVLDVGCGTGFAVIQMASMVSEGKACGIDISPEMASKRLPQDPRSISLARKKFLSEKLKCHLQEPHA